MSMQAQYKEKLSRLAMAEKKGKKAFSLIFSPPNM
jgi:hypothetical protein